MTKLVGDNTPIDELRQLKTSLRGKSYFQMALHELDEVSLSHPFVQQFAEVVGKLKQICRSCSDVLFGKQDAMELLTCNLGDNQSLTRLFGGSCRQDI